jgi:hypothetical protein
MFFKKALLITVLSICPLSQALADVTILTFMIPVPGAKSELSIGDSHFSDGDTNKTVKIEAGEREITGQYRYLITSTLRCSKTFNFEDGKEYIVKMEPFSPGGYLCTFKVEPIDLDKLFMPSGFGL